MALQIFEGFQSRFVCDEEFGLIVALISKEAQAPIESCARERAARPLLAQLGKHDQAFLFEHRNDPGFNPANPPGR